MPNEKPTARSYSAAAKTTQGLSPLQWGDKCFLCGHSIAEGAGEGFYQSKKGGFYRCHRGCLNTMEMAGGHPRDFHRVKEEAAAKKAGGHQPPVHDKPVVPDLDDDEIPPHMRAQENPETYVGPRSIRFDDLQHMQTFTAAKGPIPAHVRVSIGDYVIQAGG